MCVRTFNILLIDDDEDDYVNLRALFSEIPRTKYIINWKANYKEGLEALQKHTFDACLLDYRLGEHTGLDLLQESKQLGLMCPMIFLTGQGDFELDIKAMQVGAAEYLVKDQLTAPLLERTLRYAMKHALDMEELRESKAQILQQDRLASLGLLASSLAHEIGTPLGIIRSRAEIFARRSATDDATKQDMSTIIKQIDRIAKLVNSLLHLARDKQSAIGAAVDLNSVVQDVLNLVQHEFDRKEISVETKIPEGTCVKAEAGPLGQVFLNLFVNAAYAMEEAKKQGRSGGHKLSVAADTLNGSVEISVKDTGCGVSEKNLPQLFKPFFTTKDIGVGTGLGLATSYKLIQSWDGSILVESKEGEGTTFRIRLKAMSGLIT
jgi:signal transduction histidine kinase